MSRLPVVSGQDAISAFAKIGFQIDRIRGSHHVLTKTDCPEILVVPVHGARALKRGTLRALIRAAGISVEEFVELLKS